MPPLPTYALFVDGELLGFTSVERIADEHRAAGHKVVESASLRFLAGGR